MISIHALREESDLKSTVPIWVGPYFNPRSPWGERLWFVVADIAEPIFQSTLSVRRATKLPHYRAPKKHKISIHALREESDNMLEKTGCENRISIHALREESDRNFQRLISGF